MRIFTLTLLLTSFSSSAAFFGVHWGEDIDQYGELTKIDDYYKVVTNKLPEHILIAKQYELLQQPDNGLVKVSMISHEYSAFSDSFQHDYVALQDRLISNGFQTKEFRQSELSSYQCIFQGECVGMLWVGIDNDESMVVLEQKMNGRERSIIQLELKSHIFLSAN